MAASEQLLLELAHRSIPFPDSTSSFSSGLSERCSKITSAPDLRFRTSPAIRSRLKIRCASYLLPHGSELSLMLLENPLVKSYLKPSTLYSFIQYEAMLSTSSRVAWLSWLKSYPHWASGLVKLLFTLYQGFCVVGLVPSK